MVAPVLWGSEFRVNTEPTNDQYEPVTAVLKDGSILVVYSDLSQKSPDTSSIAIRARIVNPDGTEKVPEFVVNTTTNAAQRAPAVTVLNDGRFVIAWEDTSTINTSLRGRVYGADGNNPSAELAIGSGHSAHQGSISLAALADGGFIATYDVWTEGSSSNDVWTNRFDAALQQVSQLKIGPDVYRSNPAVAALTDDTHVLTYLEPGEERDVMVVRARIVTNAGESVKEIELNGSSYSDHPEVVALTGGRFVITWINSDPDTGTLFLKAQIFEANGEAVGNAFEVASGIGGIPGAVVALKDGGFAITYSALDPNEIDVYDVYLAAFDRNGSSQGSTRVNTSLTGGQFEPALATLPDGRLIVTWTDGQPRPDDPSGTSIRAQIVDPRAALAWTGTAEADDFVGTIYGDALNGAGGHDRLSGEAGNDTLEGGAGADALIGGAGSDNASYAKATSGVTASLLAGRGTAGEAAGDSYDGIEGLIGSAFADNLTGNGAGNILQGGGGADTLDGGVGADAMYGGAGDDLYLVDSAADVVSEAGGSGVDTVRTSASYTLGADLENLDGSGGGLVFTGNGLNNTITGNGAGNWIDGGAGADQLKGQGGDDTYLVDSFDQVTELAGQGYDTVIASGPFTLSADAEVEVLKLAGISSRSSAHLTGSNFNNAITGNAGANTLKGQGGHDRVSGGLGNDKLYGGSGKDVFVFDTALHKTRNVDRVYDFKSKDDSVWLDNRYFTKLGSGSPTKPKKFTSDMFVEGTRAKDREDRIVYDKKSGALYYDKDGTGGSAQVKIATISNKTKLSWHDFYVI